MYVSMTESDVVISKRLAGLIDVDEFARAVDEGDAYLKHHPNAHASVAFRVYYAAQLAGKPSSLVPSLLAANVYSGYTLTEHGDVLRQVTSSMIRGRFLKKVPTNIKEVAFLRQQDDDRLAAVAMLWGQYFLANKQPREAVAKHEDAQTMWEHCEAPITFALFHENQFHALRAYAASGKSNKSLYRAFMASELHRGRRARARLLHYLRHWYYWIDAIIEYRW